MKTANFLKINFIALFAICLVSCNKETEVPPEEEVHEIITDVTLKFVNDADETDVVTAVATDPDGEGVEELKISDAIELGVNKTYTLSIIIENKLDPNDVEDITAEVKEEGAEHQLFFAFSEDAFADPAGNGNIDDAADAVNYLDKDANENNLGLSTKWTTGSEAVEAGKFEVRLMHQPDVKTPTSGVESGDADFSLEFVLKIQ